MVVVEDDKDVSQGVVDKICAAVEVVLDRGADLAGCVDHTGNIEHGDVIGIDALQRRTGPGADPLPRDAGHFR